jgi:hypothetical protein
MKPCSKALHFLLLFAAFHLSLHVAYPDLPGDYLCDSNLVYGQKNFALLPICHENREAKFEKAPLWQEISTVAVFLRPGHDYHKLLTLAPEPFRTNITFPVSKELLNLFCVLRI